MDELHAIEQATRELLETVHTVTDRMLPPENAWAVLLEGLTGHRVLVSGMCLPGRSALVVGAPARMARRPPVCTALIVIMHMHD
jgi:hypothetical protein